MVCGRDSGLVCARAFGDIERAVFAGQHDQGCPLRMGLPAIRHGIDRPAAGPVQLVTQGPAQLAAHQRSGRPNGVWRTGSDKHWAARIEGFRGSFICEWPGRPSGRLGHALAFRGKRTILATGSDARGQRDAECVSLGDLSCVVTEFVHSLHMRCLRNDSTCGRTVLLPVNVQFSAAPAAS